MYARSRSGLVLPFPPSFFFFFASVLIARVEYGIRGLLVSSSLSRTSPPVNKLRSRTFLRFPAIVYMACSCSRTYAARGCFFPRDGPPNFSCGARSRTAARGRKVRGRHVFCYYESGTLINSSIFSFPIRKLVRYVPRKGICRNRRFSDRIFRPFLPRFRTSRI